MGRILSGRSEIGLNEAGRREAADLAGRLGGAGLKTIHSSPRRRARETAEAAASKTGLPIQPADALDEIDFGSFAGVAFAELERNADWRRWNMARGSARCPGGETMAEAVRRAWDYLAALRSSQLPALCVTHCDIIRGLVAHVLGLDYGRMLTFDCDPASLTTLANGGDRWRLVTLNSRAVA